ncbi:unnamed protein product [Medioppia subpectinata]|uniref:SAM-dependent MTase TRM10-type domain-containing protein n=1 Tax=Medioppia subpectinata TaxID=1979941 RepID=A0A7R9PTP6_9ACAR|nr:unnamed protein product [Medioppia subpectinata]CAG2100357.1 unnamed protein product [Medioppia subpectinata]
MNSLFNSNNLWSFITRHHISRHWFSTGRQLWSQTGDHNEEVVEDNAVEVERHFDDLSVKQFECLAKTADQMNDIEMILSSYEYTKYETQEVPSSLTLNDMKQLMGLKSGGQRNSYMNFLYQKEIQSIHSKRLRDIRKTLKEKELSDKWIHMKDKRTGLLDDNGDIVYGLWHNSLFTRISPANIRRYSVHRLRSAALFGQNIVFDLSCDPQMSQTNCAKKLRQLVNAYQTNRFSFSQPFNLHFANIDYKSMVWDAVQENQLVANYPHFLSAFTPKSYLDLFDRKDLVYLSPKADRDLEYESNKTYIIGFGDEYYTKDVTRVKSRNEKIAMRRLPIDRYCLWSKGSKDLYSSVVLSILNDMSEGIGWQKAFERNISKSRFKTDEEIEAEKLYRMNKMNRKNKMRQRFNDSAMIYK